MALACAPLGVSQKSQFLRLCSIEHNSKNWMTLNTVRGAQASAMVYSITETARANGLNVYYYVKHLLTELLEIIRIDGSVDKKELESLMPWSKDLPAECYSKRRK